MANAIPTDEKFTAKQLRDLTNRKVCMNLRSFSTVKSSAILMKLVELGLATTLPNNTSYGAVLYFVTPEHKDIIVKAVDSKESYENFIVTYGVKYTPKEAKAIEDNLFALVMGA